MNPALLASRQASLKLTEAKEGMRCIVTETIGEEITWQALRFGISAGAHIKIQKVIPKGPVIISKNQLEIAIGRDLASLIEVKAI